VQPAVREGLHGLQGLCEDAFEALELALPAPPRDYFEQLARETTSLGIFAQRLMKAEADAPTAEKRAHLARVLQAGVAAYRGEQEPLPDTEELS